MTTLGQPVDFTQDYLASWTERDPERRDAIIERIWSPGGALSVSSTGETLVGIPAIAAHITRVHDDLIAGKGLVFRYDQEVVSGETLLLRWSMAAPNGDIVGRGVDTVVFSEERRIASAHMFMGVK